MSIVVASPRGFSSSRTFVRYLREWNSTTRGKIMEIAKAIEVFLTILFFPNFSLFIDYAWGVGDPLWVASLKRAFLILPVLAIILGYWTSVVALLTAVIRAEKQAFLNAILMTWWDLGKAIFSFWGGIFRFTMMLSVTVFAVLRLAIVGLWVLCQDLVLIPFRVARNLTSGLLAPGTPWIAVGLTLFWCLLEATIFTYVTSPLVTDTLGNITGDQISTAFIRFPLFLFMLFIVLGSYSVLSSWTAAMKSKDVPTMVKIGVIELVALFVEVVFLYREFVDALIPWFAQYAGQGFEPGLFGVLSVASMTWFGIRGMSWFLFASAGTPTIMAVIQGQGIKNIRAESHSAMKGSFQLIGNLILQIKSEMEWVRSKGEDLLGAFILPPLQVVAGAINFCTLLIAKQHLFKLPFRHVNELRAVPTLIQNHGLEVKSTPETRTRKKAA